MCSSELTAPQSEHLYSLTWIDCVLIGICLCGNEGMFKYNQILTKEHQGGNQASVGRIWNYSSTTDGIPESRAIRKQYETSCFCGGTHVGHVNIASILDDRVTLDLTPLLPLGWSYWSTSLTLTQCWLKVSNLPTVDRCWRDTRNQTPCFFFTMPGGLKSGTRFSLLDAVFLIGDCYAFSQICIICGTLRSQASESCKDSKTVFGTSYILVWHVYCWMRATPYENTRVEMCDQSDTNLTLW